MYDKVDSSLDFLARELEVLEFWEKNNIFEKTIEQRSDAPVFSFYDGPPTANGRPHIGHVLTRAIKDLIPRYRAMKGYRVERKAGWDTHGLPVELEVEKALGIDGKDQIEAYGIEPFIKACKESVWKYKAEWEEMSRRVGFWADMEHPYVTYENDYIESVWWALRQIWDKDLLYHGHKVVPYCPRCGTALSSHEVAQGYQDVEDESIYVRFKVLDEENTYIAAWTTTPWTLPSNVALVVNPDVDYVLVEAYVAETDDLARYYLAKPLAEKTFGEGVKILEEMKGSDLVGKAYEPIFPFAKDIVEKSGKRAWYVASDDYVTTEDGTGVVHTAPAFGEDDDRVAKIYDLPFIQLVNVDGTMKQEVKGFEGVFVKDADKGLIEYIKKDNNLLKVESYEHSYPFCWRCDTPLIYYARATWFIEMTKVKENLLKNNAKINWLPPSIGTGRFGNFLENVVDWGLSRERYWGTPLPIWECESCEHKELIGSIEELKSRSDKPIDEIELHRPYIDEVTFDCSCGGKMHRVPEVIDGWFDSGSMPFAQYHYPFENKELFEEQFPADFISEAVDQTRGWFYTLLAIATLLFDDTSFMNCIVMGHVQDADGVKMSKHKGNVIDPEDILSSEGADAVRWYFYTGSQPWLPSRFSYEAVAEAKRKYMGTFWNAYAFYVLYANIDNFNPIDYDYDLEQLNVMDRWILSRLHTLIQNVDDRLERYDITGSGRALQQFTEELSNWYIRRGRERYWGAEMTQDKIHAYLTLYTALKTLAELSAPFTPFMSETIYQNLAATKLKGAAESVHLADFPKAGQHFIDKELEKSMATVLDIVTLGRAARNTAQIKNRQPLSKLIVVGAEALADEYIDLIEDELNVKEVTFQKDDSGLLDYAFKPQLKILGKKLGAKLPKVNESLRDIDGIEAMRTLKEKGSISITIDGEAIELTEEELIIEQKQREGLVSETDNGISVSLITTLTDDLIEEGFVREVISKVQTMRRESGFEVTDRIVLRVGNNEMLENVIDENQEFIKAEVLADRIEKLHNEEGKNWNINGEMLNIAVEKI
ncbi:MAG TPA: isoleucine--tRNA ligase [Fastidiosipila sp.]|nr:isoleucine--tRNA ligase [Fastidiosipila sp.]